MRTKPLKTIGKLLAAIMCVVLVQTPLLTLRAATLNKNAIIPDSETQLPGVTSTQINDYFSSRNSQLANYTIPHDFDVYFPTGQGQWDKIAVTQAWQSATELEVYYGKTVAQLIYEWSYTSRPDRGSNSPSPGQINPLIAMATLDKESASVTGGYRTTIVSERPITLSWAMGYGFNDRMANCVANGDCNVDYNRQAALYYGGPGQQLAEGISALKRWSTNPTTISSCSSNWQNYRIQGECLNLENGISYALYRYTPTFSGNTLFLNLYNTIKGSFSYTPPPSGDTDYTSNDTDSYSLRTYDSSVNLTGKKTAATKAYLGDTLIAAEGTTSWQTTLSINEGTSNYTIQYRKPDGTLVNQKAITLNRNKLGDINSDSSVDILDLSLLSQYWGQSDPPNPLVNLNPSADNVVDILDLSLLANNFH